MMLTVEEAYAGMVRYLEKYYERTHTEDVGALPGDLQIDGEGKPFDPAAWEDWIEATVSVKQELETP